MNILVQTYQHVSSLEEEKKSVPLNSLNLELIDFVLVSKNFQLIFKIAPINLNLTPSICISFG